MPPMHQRPGSNAISRCGRGIRGNSNSGNRCSRVTDNSPSGSLGAALIAGASALAFFLHAQNDAMSFNLLRCNALSMIGSHKHRSIIDDIGGTLLHLEKTELSPNAMLELCCFRLGVAVACAQIDQSNTSSYWGGKWLSDHSMSSFSGIISLGFAFSADA